MNQSKGAVTKYCKVCHDSGKSEKEYTSHFTRENRDPNARIICPILKALECRYCFKSGHTVKYCPVLKNKKKYVKKEKVEKVEKTEKKEVNKFACLFEDEDQETFLKPIISYASVLKSEQKKVEPETSIMMNPKVLDQTVTVEVAVKPLATYVPRRRVLDWAAECDSDSDDE